MALLLSCGENVHVTLGAGAAALGSGREAERPGWPRWTAPSHISYRHLTEPGVGGSTAVAEFVSYVVITLQNASLSFTAPEEGKLFLTF